MKLDDNKFEVAFADVKNYRDIVKMFIMMNALDIKDVPGITYYKTNNLEIEFIDPPKTSWCIDGEELTPVTDEYNISIKNNVEILMPTKNVKELFKK